MNQRSTMLKVLSPVEGKNGKTFWMRVGNAFVNRDGSTNVYLDAYPTSGKLQLRSLDERDKNVHNGTGSQMAYRAATESRSPSIADQDDLPF